MISTFLSALLLCSLYSSSTSISYEVRLLSRSSAPVLSYVDGTSTYQQVFNPTWVAASRSTNGRSGIIVRTQDCNSSPQVAGAKCTFCGGDQANASVLTFSELSADGSGFKRVDSSSVVFGPSQIDDSWGTEDPRMIFNPLDQLYYMMYTAYNGSAIFLSMATSKNPTSSTGNWIKHGPVFPSQPGSKSGALILAKKHSGDNFLLWGDHDIRIARSANLLSWPDIGETLLQVRTDSFDSQLVESGPPPLLLDSGDYLFFYNSATIGWPSQPNTSYNVGWVILDGSDPTIIKARASVPLISPLYAWETGNAPYTCNAPNVVFLEAAYSLGGDKFQVFLGAADATIGSAVVEVVY